MNKNEGRYMLLVSLFVLAAHTGYAQGLSGLYAKVSPAIVHLVVRTDAKDTTFLGSGFFVSPNGVIITNYHVIKRARSITVYNSYGRADSNVRVGSCDTTHDLAALSVSWGGTSFLQPAAPGSYAVGQDVIAIGNPLGLANTLSQGIISGLRALPGRFEEIIQTTAPISPGSSGGPLLTTSGSVVGVTTFQSVIGQNLNFAIPLHSFLPTALESRWLSVGEWRKSLLRPRLEREMSQVSAILKTGQQAIAVQKLKAILAADDTYVDALILLAGIQIKNFDYSGATKSLGRCLSLDPSRSEAYFLQGTLLVRMHQPQQALRSFEHSFTLDPRNGYTHDELKRLYLLAGDTSHARAVDEAFRRATGN